LIISYLLASYPSGLRGRFAKPLFAGSNPADASILKELPANCQFPVVQAENVDSCFKLRKKQLYANKFMRNISFDGGQTGNGKKDARVMELVDMMDLKSIG
jgi:hypothetical protein